MEVITNVVVVKNQALQCSRTIHLRRRMTMSMSKQSFNLGFALWDLGADLLEQRPKNGSLIGFGKDVEPLDILPFL
jgi:hypothetical protein